MTLWAWRPWRRQARSLSTPFRAVWPERKDAEKERVIYMYMSLGGGATLDPLGLAALALSGA